MSEKLITWIIYVHATLVVLWSTADPNPGVYASLLTTFAMLPVYLGEGTLSRATRKAAKQCTTP